jgi:hypothetical protein
MAKFPLRNKAASAAMAMKPGLKDTKPKGFAP